MNLIDMSPFYPTGQVVPIVGTNNNEHGRCCDFHNTCGAQVMIGDLLRVLVVDHPSCEEFGVALGVFTIKNGNPACKIGFLQKCMVPHRHLYDHALLIVTDVYSERDEDPERRKVFRQNYGWCDTELVRGTDEQVLAFTKTE